MKIKRAGDRERFARVYFETWARLPPETRAEFGQHWRGSSPEIFLLSTWHGRGRAIAQCFLGGFFFRFHGSTIDAMPPDVLSELIAHELAHVPAFARTGLIELPSRPEFEAEADELVKSWGFDGRAKIEAWFASREFTPASDGALSPIDNSDTVSELRHVP